jgi:hypothetical protein
VHEQEGFFSPKHAKLLNTATWAKYLAWIALLFAFLTPFAKYVEIRNIYQYQAIMAGQQSDFANQLLNNTVYGLSVLTEILDSFLTGFIYFLVSRGISLGLNMIVETDINYREQKKGDT